jgi:hypothetical protein
MTQKKYSKKNTEKYNSTTSDSTITVPDKKHVQLGENHPGYTLRRRIGKK